MRNIGQNDVASADLREIESRPAGACPDVQQPHARPKPEEVGNRAGFIARRPARCAVIAAEDVALEIAYRGRTAELVIPREAAPWGRVERHHRETLATATPACRRRAMRS